MIGSEYIRLCRILKGKSSFMIFYRHAKFLLLFKNYHSIKKLNICGKGAMNKTMVKREHGERPYSPRYCKRDEAPIISLWKTGRLELRMNSSQETCLFLRCIFLGGRIGLTWKLERTGNISYLVKLNHRKVVFLLTSMYCIRKRGKIWRSRKLKMINSENS